MSVQHIRELALRRIIRAMKENTTKSGKCTFVIPPFTFEAKLLRTLKTDIIDWQSCSPTQRPLTFHIPDQELEVFVQRNKKSIELMKIILVRFPCDNQALERYIEYIFEAEAAVTGASARH